MGRGFSCALFLAGIMLLATAGQVEAAPTIETRIFLLYGMEDVESDDLPYAYDTDRNDAIISGELGDGDVLGAGVQLLFDDKWTLALDYEDRDFDGSSSVDTDPTASNDCNIEPLQGLISDCWDTGLFDSNISRKRVDVIVGRQFGFGSSSVTLTPFAGVRYSSLEQEVDVSFLFPGGLENFISRELEFDGWGLQIGAATDVPFGSSNFYFQAAVSVAKLTGDRDLEVVDIELSSGAFNQRQEFSESVDLDPLTFDGSVRFGYKFSKLKTPIGLLLGYRYSVVQDFLDTRNTNDTSPYPQFTVGSEMEDFETQGPFFQFMISF